MIRAIVALLLLTVFGANSADIALALQLPASANSVEKFVPSGWEIESKVSGDLNHDDKADTAIVLRKMDQTLFIDGRNGNPRILAVMFSSPAGHYDLISLICRLSLLGECGLLVHWQCHINISVSGRMFPSDRL